MLYTNPLKLPDVEKEINNIVTFLRNVFEKNLKTTAVIAVSGGIDSALSLSLLARALPIEKIVPVFLPYKDQSTEDARALCTFLKIPEKNCQTLQIEKMVEASVATIMSELSSVRLGNIMARCRMILVYDIAKLHDALVCGTENKSEHYLGYFTRFGDAASDIEPISHLYKTQVRHCVQYLGLPSVFLEKAPSAGLWSGQTDESEMGFGYDDADQVLYQVFDKKIKPETISDVSPEIVKKVLQQVESMKFKREVPYLPMTSAGAENRHG